NRYEQYLVHNRWFGPYWPAYWALILCNGVIPQLLWIRYFRQNLIALWLISQVVSIGMWLERYVIIPISLHREYLPSKWGYYTPTIWDIGMFAGTIGFFIFMMFLFVRFVPMINIFEIKDLLLRRQHADAHVHAGDGHGGNGHAHAHTPAPEPID